MSGGVEWEQGQAVTRMVQALIAGDHEAMARSMADYAAALGTRTTNILSGIVTTVLLELQQTRLERQTDARIIEHKLDLILLANDALRIRITAIEDAMIARAAERQHFDDLIRTIPNLTARIEQLEASGDAE